MRVSGVAADISDGFVDVAIGHRQVRSAIKIHIEEQAAKSESVPRRCPDAGWNRHIVENSRSGGAIQADHFIVEVGDGHTGLARTIEVSGVDAHAGAGLSFCAKRQASLHRDILEFSVPQIAVQLIRLGVVGYQ